MNIAVNKFEYEFLKKSLILQDLAKQHDKTIKEMIREYCEIGDDDKFEEILLQSDTQTLEEG